MDTKDLPPNWSQMTPVQRFDYLIAADSPGGLTDNQRWIADNILKGVEAGKYYAPVGPGSAQPWHQVSQGTAGAWKGEDVLRRYPDMYNLRQDSKGNWVSKTFKGDMPEPAGPSLPQGLQVSGWTPAAISQTPTLPAYNTPTTTTPTTTPTTSTVPNTTLPNYMQGGTGGQTVGSSPLAQVYANRFKPMTTPFPNYYPNRPNPFRNRQSIF